MRTYKSPPQLADTFTTSFYPPALDLAMVPPLATEPAIQNDAIDDRKSPGLPEKGNILFEPEAEIAAVEREPSDSDYPKGAKFYVILLSLLVTFLLVTLGMCASSVGVCRALFTVFVGM